MPRVNERCIEHTPDEYRVNCVQVAPAREVAATAQDLNGAKIHCCWIKSDKSGVVFFEYLSRLGDMLLEEIGPFPLDVGRFTRFNFGTYKVELPLPAMLLRVRIQNTSQETACICMYGMSQLQ